MLHSTYECSCRCQAACKQQHIACSNSLVGVHEPLAQPLSNWHSHGIANQGPSLSLQALALSKKGVLTCQKIHDGSLAACSVQALVCDSIAGHVCIRLGYHLHRLTNMSQSCMTVTCFTHSPGGPKHLLTSRLSASQSLRGAALWLSTPGRSKG